ncbi:MAG: hypothetical protein K9H84_02640 [Bacteroidales bacterium]|nr:hypothetical protein [Bacteroidales bacterium]
MKAKVFVILLFLGLLAFLVYKMLQYETELHKKEVVKEYIRDETVPLLEKKSPEELRSISYKADYYFRAKGDYFSILDYGYQKIDPHWDTVLMKGINMGLALPGKFPAEFALTYEQYMDWLIKIGNMNTNVIRVYTILPPVFYEAFAQYNLQHQDKPLYLFHGVWAIEPPEHDYRNETYTRAIKREIKNALDVLHGNAVLYPDKGKASGVYAVDVSEYVVGLILGREWEPTGVYVTNQKYDIDHYYGDFVSMIGGNAMEAWLAEIMDFTVLYETQTYQMQHPVSFVNWLPLDPMYHNTEIIENEKVREFDNDLEVVHFERFHSSELFDPGIFASYHVYPYYPDYIYLKKQYAKARNIESKADNYFGYLQDLKSRHKGMPLIIAEYGVPSSRGNSHFTPFGFDQGGHSEREQAEISMMLTKDIFHTGCAGAVYFEWTDEWFKHNWLVMDFEKPFQDRKIWHNMENPEQNFGIMALEARERTIDGKLNDWKDNWKDKKGVKIQFHADPSYFYVASGFSKLDLQKHNLFIAIDTYAKDKGDKRLPFIDKKFSRGFEFLVEINSTDSARILVDEPYSVYTDIYHDSIPVYSSKPNSNGKYVKQLLLSNRGRQSLTGEVFPPGKFNRSKLQHGKSDQSETSNADWFWDADRKQLEMRLTWHLLNISDPAKRYVLDDKPGTDKIEYSRTDGFYLKIFATDKNNRVTDEWPENGYFQYTWEMWDEPEWSARIKPLYDSLKNYFGHIKPSDFEIQLKQKSRKTGDFTICKYFENHKGAVSFSFSGTDFSHYNLVYPLLEKYHTKATFVINPELLSSVPERRQTDDAGLRRRLTVQEIKEMQADQHTLALFSDNTNLEALTGLFRSKLDKKPFLLHTPRTDIKQTEPFYFVRKYSDNNPNSYKGIDFYNLHGNEYSTAKLDSLFKHVHQSWFILNYKYITPDIQSERNPELFIAEKQFEWQLRLARNHEFWLSDEWNVYKYLFQRENSEVKVSKYNNLIFVNLETNLDPDVFDHPLTICYKTDAPYVMINKPDGEYTLTNRTGNIFFNIRPEDQLTIKEIW